MSSYYGMESKKIDEGKKIAIAIKAARTAAGLTQAAFAKRIGISKATLARIETLEIAMKLDVYFHAMHELKNLGIVVDATDNDDIVIRVTPEGQRLIVDNWEDATRRRSDRKL